MEQNRYNSVLSLRISCEVTIPGDRKFLVFCVLLQEFISINSDNCLHIEMVLHLYTISFLICVYRMAAHFHGP